VPIVAAAALFLAACGSTATLSSTATTSSTTTTTIVNHGQSKPVDLFTKIPCQSGYVFSALAFGERQKVLCIHKDTIFTLNLEVPPAGDHWGVSGMSRSTHGDIVAMHSQGDGGRFSFVYRAVQSGTDYVHVLMLTPCPKAGCVAEGPAVPEAQWVVRVVGPTDPYPATLTMQRGLTFSTVGRALPWGTRLNAAQAREVTIKSPGGTYRWGVWVTGHGPTFPVRSTDDGADWTAAGPQLATDWAGGSLYYVSKVISVSSSAAVMVSNSIMDITTDRGREWYQYLNAGDNWVMVAYPVSGEIGLRVSPTSYATSLPKASYAIYEFEVAEHQWYRIRQSFT
jgi:hypothetical protein